MPAGVTSRLTERLGLRECTAPSSVALNRLRLLKLASAEGRLRWPRLPTTRLRTADEEDLVTRNRVAWALVWCEVDQRGRSERRMSAAAGSIAAKSNELEWTGELEWRVCLLTVAC